MKKVLITGANGYIGKCLFYFLRNKFKIIGIDKKKSSERKILHCNILNKKKLDRIIKKEKPEIVIHLAAQSLVDETINKKKYYDNNNKATKILLEIIKKNNIKKIIFSSTAAIYQQSVKPLKENSSIKAISTYAKTKLLCEKKIQNEKNLKSIILRFFNVCSALNRPIIGEFHNPETHLVPTIVYKAMYNKKIYIYGKNFNTMDGTCIRDYIHIKDICLAIEKSVNYLFRNNKSNLFNVGNNKGLSNKEIVSYVKKKIGKNLSLEYVHKRKGDVAKLVCDSNKIRNILGWNAKNSNIKKIVDDEIKWILKLNKDGLKRKFKNYFV